eukprot:TRINITY_DN123833_c0_g1_i1.p1 TRINITY_DN123833_c0_g1~~TRINITY_DN123833_c0_g1_i1.p1  ORF type:complete len:321 (+),score=71.08 TRINITY_DN123833_c0_g1_i1:63-1025(+)
MAKQLHHVFVSFAGGDEMDNRSFVKCLKDSDIIDKTVTSTDADLIFARYRPKGARKIDFDGFQACITALASKKKMTEEEFIAKLCASSGPILNGTQAEAVKFHDDRSLYTGVHLRGGPTNIGNGKSGYKDLSTLIDRDLVQDDMINRRAGRAGGEVIVATKANPVSVVQKSSTGGEQPAERADEDARRASQVGLALLTQAFSDGAAAEDSSPDSSKPGVCKKSPRGPERFYYDKKSYTGVHAQGGPRTHMTGTEMKEQLNSLGGFGYAPAPGKPTDPTRGPERFFYDRSTYTGSSALKVYDSPTGNSKGRGNVPPVRQIR